jgi:hypothetical protein
LLHFIKNLLWSYPIAFYFGDSEALGGRGNMNQPDCIAGSRHVLIYPYFAFGAARYPWLTLGRQAFYLFVGAADNPINHRSRHRVWSKVIHH